MLVGKLKLTNVGVAHAKTDPYGRFLCGLCIFVNFFMHSTMRYLNGQM